MSLKRTKTGDLAAIHRQGSGKKNSRVFAKVTGRRQATARAVMKAW